MVRVWKLDKSLYLQEMQYFHFQLDADCGDVIALGGNLSPGLLLSAYQQGIFPWYNAGEEICWWSPSQRFVLLPEELHLRKSLRKQAKRKLTKSHVEGQAEFRLSIDRAFAHVIVACAQTPRCGQQMSDGSAGTGTWITKEMQAAYVDLHMRSYAHSVECWQCLQAGNGGTEEHLVGGLYGVALGRCFFGESMFSCVADASKIAFAAFVLFLRDKGFRLIDCQQETAHLGSFGARNLKREEFLQRLANCNLEEEFLSRSERKAFWTGCAEEFPSCPAFDRYLCDPHK